MPPLVPCRGTFRPMTTPAELIERLASRDGDVRTAAADALYDLGDAAVAP